MRSIRPNLFRFLVDFLRNGDRHDQPADNVSLRGLTHSTRHIEPSRPVVVISIRDGFGARAELPSGLFGLQDICRRSHRDTHLIVAPRRIARRLVAHENMTLQLRQRAAENLIFASAIHHGAGG